jgi:hypothetical protein
MEASKAVAADCVGYTYTITQPTARIAGDGYFGNLLGNGGSPLQTNGVYAAHVARSGLGYDYRLQDGNGLGVGNGDYVGNGDGTNFCDTYLSWMVSYGSR